PGAVEEGAVPEVARAREPHVDPVGEDERGGRLLELARVGALLGVVDVRRLVLRAGEEHLRAEETLLLAVEDAGERVGPRLLGGREREGHDLPEARELVLGVAEWRDSVARGTLRLVGGAFEAPGGMLGPYRLVRELGKGGTATVYEA